MQTLEKIRILREWRRFKQAQMAEWLFIDQSTYSKIESGKINLLESTKLEILSVLAMSSEDFERWDGTFELHFQHPTDGGGDQISPPPPHSWRLYSGQSVGLKKKRTRSARRPTRCPIIESSSVFPELVHQKKEGSSLFMSRTREFLNSVPQKTEPHSLFSKRVHPKG